MPPDRLYNQLGQLRETFLSAVAFSRNHGFNPDEVERWVYAVHTNANAVLVRDGDGDGDGDATGLVDLEAEIVWSPDENELPPEGEPPFALSLTVTGLFSWLGDKEHDEDAKGWLEVNGEYLLWPYLRSHVQMITGASDLPSLTIYTLGVPQPFAARQALAEQTE